MVGHQNWNCGVPLGISIIGGLIVSQLLTLYTTPVVYLYFDRLQNWWTGYVEEAGRKSSPSDPRHRTQARNERHVRCAAHCQVNQFQAVNHCRPKYSES